MHACMPKRKIKIILVQLSLSLKKKRKKKEKKKRKKKSFTAKYIWTKSSSLEIVSEISIKKIYIYNLIGRESQR